MPEVLEVVSGRARTLHRLEFKNAAAAELIQLYKWQPSRLRRPWDSPGKDTGVGCHFLLQCMKVESEREVAQSCLTLCNPMDCNLPGSSVMGFSKQEYWSGLPSLVQEWALPCPACWSLHSREHDSVWGHAIRIGSTGRVLSDPACPQHNAHGLLKVSATPVYLADPDTIRASSHHARTQGHHYFQPLLNHSAIPSS